MDSQTAYEAFELRLRIAEAEREMHTVTVCAPIQTGTATKICNLAHFLYYAYDRYLKMTGINLRPPVEEDSY